MEIIQHKNKVVALIFQPDSNLEETKFFTPQELPLQVGYMRYKSGDLVRPHTHPSVEQTITNAIEVVIVYSGLCEVTLYSDDATQLAARTLEPGDALVMIGGAHSFRMLQDTVIYLIKQGPYSGAEENKKIVQIPFQE